MPLLVGCLTGAVLAHGQWVAIEVKPRLSAQRARRHRTRRLIHPDTSSHRDRRLERFGDTAFRPPSLLITDRSARWAATRSAARSEDVGGGKGSTGLNRGAPSRRIVTAKTTPGSIRRPLASWASRAAVCSSSTHRIPPSSRLRGASTGCSRAASTVSPRAQDQVMSLGRACYSSRWLVLDRRSTS